MQELKESITKSDIGFYVSILIPLLAVAVSWGVLTTRLSNVEEIANNNQSLNRDQVTVNQDIQVKLAEIKKDVSYIRAELDKK